jgi:hypothetical protein
LSVHTSFCPSLNERYQYKKPTNKGRKQVWYTDFIPHPPTEIHDFVCNSNKGQKSAQREINSKKRMNPGDTKGIHYLLKIFCWYGHCVDEEILIYNDKMLPVVLSCTGNSSIPCISIVPIL